MADPASKKIIQVIPADGWYAYYRYDTEIVRNRIVCVGLAVDGTVVFLDADACGEISECCSDDGLTAIKYEGRDGGK